VEKIHHTWSYSSDATVLDDYALMMTTMGPFSTWMGDCLCLWAGKPSRYVTLHLGQLSLLSLRGR